MDSEHTQLDKVDALVTVHQRNDFYRTKYQLAFGIFLLSVVIIFILAGILFYLVKHPTRPLYFVADPEGRLLKNIPNTDPNMTTDAVMVWATEAIEAAFTYDFVNYRAQLQNAQKYFSDFGWRTYMNTLTSSKNLVGLTKRQLVFIAKVTGKPKVVIQGMLGGAYAWKFEMPLLVTVLQPPAYDDATSFRNPFVVNVIVQRQNLLQSYKGLAVIQIIITNAV